MANTRHYGLRELCSRAPKVTEEDRKAWQAFAARVRPFAGGVRFPAPLPLPASRAAKAPAVRLNARGRQLTQPLLIGQAPPGLDRASWRHFSSGQMRPALTLDLHGMTAAEAIVALEEFLQRAAALGYRTVEVITGRGAGPQGGVIRREFPHWLNGPALRPLLLGACHPARTNPGAVRLLLRKQR